MDLHAPVHTVMKTNLVTVSEEDGLDKIMEIFKNQGFRHLPVVQFKTLKGLISLSDIAFLFEPHSPGLTEIRDKLNGTGHLKARDLMVSRLGKLEPTDRIEVAIDIFLNHGIHCLPVVSDGELVGLVTPNDILRGLVK